MLVSTHYMDEAERCHEVGYLAGGNLLVHGGVGRRLRPGRGHPARRRAAVRGTGARSLWLLPVALVVFIAANLAVGFTFSTMADNQLQAMEMTFFFLPSLLLSGFLFPFRGMAEWAQMLGSLFPLTHFLRIGRGIPLKGSGWSEMAPEIWPILLFMLVAGVVALNRYRETLD